MARLDWVHQRLLNWQRYMLRRDGGSAFSKPSYEERVDGEGWDAPTVIPINDDEARKTGEAIDRLPGELIAAVRVKYLGVLQPSNRRERVATTEAAQLAKLCCHRSTLYARLERADRLLSADIEARRLRMAAERARAEGVIANARPR